MFVKMLILFSFRYIRKIFSRWNRLYEMYEEVMKIWKFDFLEKQIYCIYAWIEIRFFKIEFTFLVRFLPLYMRVYIWQSKVSRFAGTRIVYSRMEIRSLECAIFKGYARFKQATTVNFRFTTEQWFPICRSS